MVLSVRVPLLLILLCVYNLINASVVNGVVIDSTFINDFKSFDKSNDYNVTLIHDRISNQKQNNSLEDLRDSYAELSRYYMDLEAYPLSIKYAEKALSMKVEMTPLFKADCYYDIGGALYELGQYAISKNFVFYAQDLYKANNDSSLFALTNNQLGLIAIEEQQYALAGSYLSDALEYMNNNNVEFGIAAVCNNIGILQIKQGQTDSAMVMLNRALLYNKKLEREYGMAEVYNNLANLSSMHQEYNIGLMYLDSAEHYIRSYKSTELLIDNLKYRTTIYAGLENYQMAYQQHVKYQYAYSVFVNHADIEKVIKACLRIKLGEKDDVIDAQLLEFQQKNKKKLWLITLILILFIITLSLGVIWLKDWNKKNEGNRLKIGQLEYELEYRKQEVSSLLTQLTSTKDAMRLISSTISKANDSDSDKQELREAISNMKTEIQTKKEITKLNQLLNQLHPSFFSKLKDNYPSLTESELEILGLVRMRLSTKEIAALKSSSYKAIEMGRYRARKKMNLPQNSQLSDYLDSYGCIEYNEVKAD